MAIYKKLTVVKPNDLGILYIGDRVCSFQTEEIRNEMKKLQEQFGIFELPDCYGYTVTLQGRAKICKK